MEFTEIRDIALKKTGATIEDVEDALRFIHNSYIQPSAKIQKTAEYTVSAESVSLSDIADDIYKINWVKAKGEVPLLNDDDTESYGVRRYGDTVYFQHINTGTVLTISYQQRLKGIGDIPEIEEEWHDLYWLGAVAVLDLEFMPIFLERLSEFRNYMIRKSRPAGFRVKQRLWGW